MEDTKRIFNCPRCDKKFNKKYNFDRHLKSNNSCFAKVKCTECNEDFITINEYTIHFMENHCDTQNNSIKYIANINASDNSKVTLEKNTYNITKNYKFNVFLSNISPTNFKEYPVDTLTFDKLDNLVKDGPTNSITKLIKNEYIDNVDKKDRSIWCIDLPRNKMLLRINNKWIIDNKSLRFTNMTFDKIKDKMQDIFIDELNMINKNISNNYGNVSLIEKLNNKSIKITNFLRDLKNPNVCIKTIKNINAYVAYTGEEELTDDEILQIKNEMKEDI